MRILHVGKYYAPRKGGMETALRHIVEGLLEAGHEVRAIVAGETRRTVREDLPDAPGALIRLGVLATWNSQPLTGGIVGELRRQLQDFAPDVLHLHTPNPLACWSWLRVAGQAATQGTRLAVWHHADIVRQRLVGRLVEPVVQRCLADSAGICVSSASLLDGARQLRGWRDKVVVIPFGIAPGRFAAIPTGDGPFLFVGRLVRYKGIDTLLEAVARTPDARLDIVGSGPLAPSLAVRADRPDLQGRVRMLGEVPDPELPFLLAGCRALVLPSRDRSETFGLILLEAMAAARPVIASDLPTGVRELARPGETGWLVPPGDPEALAAVLTACWDDPATSRRLGETGRALVRDRYTRSAMSARLADWYETLVRPGVPGELPSRPGV